MTVSRVSSRVFCCAGVVALSAAVSLAQRAPRPDAVTSPEVHDDRRVTLRVYAPTATKVELNCVEMEAALGGSRKAMVRGDKGVWSLTVGPLEPGIYDYTFDIDGLRITDPASPNLFPARRGARGFVDVPGPSGQPRHDEWRDVAHGSVTLHWYPSSTVGHRRRVHVYTPPGYHDDPSKRYPVLYLLHGSGDNDGHWMWLGRAHVIVDNLIADGKAVPMVIVMPDGHAIPRQSGRNRERRRGRSLEVFENDLVNDVMPFVESRYRVRNDRASRGIVGLSMGGGQSLHVGLRHLDQFAWVGAFSAAASANSPALEALRADPQRANRLLNLLWIAIGRDDFLLERNHSFIDALKTLEIKHEYHETVGSHRWSVWRRYLAQFAPRLFRPTAQTRVELLWPDGAPGAKGNEAKDKPTLTIHPAPAGTSTGTGVVVCPGGGYGGLAVGHEGRDIAAWLNSLGVAAFVLEYRHRNKGYGHPAPLQDAQRALRMVRSRAGEWNLRPDRIGILGFSAGGHLASTAGTHFDAGRPDADDPIERVSSRPDFMVLVYPVISFTTDYTHRGSRKNLLGSNPDPALVHSLSNETQVTAETPPTFMMHTNEDRGVPAENSVLFYLALRKANVPAELHVYATGRHGLGLAPGVLGTSSWPRRCADWMKGLGLLDGGSLGK